MTLVLLSDPWERHTYDVYNILRCRYPEFQPVIMSHRALAWDRRGLRMIYKCPILNVGKSSSEQFAADLNRVLTAHSDQQFVYVPLEEDTTLLMYRFLKRYRPDNLSCILPAEDRFHLVRDKKAFLAFAEANDIPVPQVFRFEDVQMLRENFVPLIAKPCVGSGAIGIKYINSPDQLTALATLDPRKYVLQRKIEDSKSVHGAFFLFDNGRFISYYGHRRIRTYPRTGGVTVYSEAACEPALKALGCRLLEMLDWSGFAMIEYLYDPEDEQYKVIEINPRLWGSFLLSEYAGARFLTNYLHLALERPPVEPEFNQDTFIRWLFPFDVINYLASGFSINGFWQFDTTNTCYINITYAEWKSALLFHAFSVFDLRKIKKLFAKALSS